jgi:DNA primase
MDISEQVLVNTLAQLVQKDVTEAGKKFKQEQKAFEIVKDEETIAPSGIDVLYELERKIIEILLLYGNKLEEFEDVVFRANAEGEIEMFTEKKEYAVYERIFLSLQEDETELANPLFREIYTNLIAYFQQNENFVVEQYLTQLPEGSAGEVTDILMMEERDALHNWESQNIVVKLKDQTIGQYVSETILTLRWYLVDRIIEELKGELSQEPDSDNSETLASAMDYYKLINSFSLKLGRVMSRY